jgi:hypothetical protein
MPEVPPIANPPVDVSLVGSPRGDVLVGQAGVNLLEGRGGNDTLTGGPVDDILDGGPGDDTLNGGDGLDTARYRGSIFDYTITRGNGGVTVGSNNPGSPDNDGNDQLTGIERLEFRDRAIYVNGINNRPLGRPDQGFETPEGVPLRVPAASLLAAGRTSKVLNSRSGGPAEG